MAAIPSLPDAQISALTGAYDRAVAQRRRSTLVGLIVLAACIALAGWIGEVRPGVLFANIDKFTSYFVRIAHLDSGQVVLADVGEWFWGLRKWLRLMGETLLIAYLGTVLGALGAFLVCFDASRNMARAGWGRLLARRFLEFCRTVPELVFALIFVVAWGLGPLPGILALAIHTMGALGKLFSEVVENIDMKPVEGAIASGGNWVQGVRFAVLPQVLSNFASYGLLRFEINVRGAAVMGFVGAGGIGQDLIEAIRKFYYSDVSAILLLIIVTVALIDLGTERIRHALIGMEERR
ncbi:MAG: phosphonate ABC transporter, permease protein PhnE [Alsobacter sp.]